LATTRLGDTPGVVDAGLWHETDEFGQALGAALDALRDLLRRCAQDEVARHPIEIEQHPRWRAISSSATSGRSGNGSVKAGCQPVSWQCIASSVRTPQQFSPSSSISVTLG
jgi:hypothetical protein